MSRPLLRPLVVDDLPACADVFYAALDELYSRNRQPPLPRNPEGMARMFGHLLATDPERCWVAADSERVVAFGIAQRRESTWFLSFLFVRPEVQSVGVGRELTEACMATDAQDDGANGEPSITRAVCAEALQPVSIGLYTSLGMMPRLPLFLTTGRPRNGPPLGAVGDLVAVPFDELAETDHSTLVRTVDGLDRAVLGYAHPQDHRFWSITGRSGWLFRDPGTGAAVGYGYASPTGRIGPVCVSEPRWLPAALDHLLAANDPPDGWQITVPGPSALLPTLIAAGLRFDGGPALYCSTSPGHGFDRYLAGNFAIL